MDRDFDIKLEFDNSIDASQRLTKIYEYLLDCHENEKDEEDEADTKKLRVE